MTVAKRLGGDSEVVSLKVRGTTFYVMHAGLGEIDVKDLKMSNKHMTL